MGARWLGAVVFVMACGGAGPEPKASEPPATPEASAPAGGDACVAKDAAGLEACAGKRVAFDGAISPNVMQHPISGGPMQPGGDPPKMNYVDVAGAGQVVVYTAAEVACGGAVSVVGDLERVDLGGEPGTKEEYKGWAVHGATITCK